MKTKKQYVTLGDMDKYPLILFAMAQIRQIPEYQCMSELAYTLDKNNFLNFVEMFGGLTIKVPTIDEIQDTTFALLLYKMVDIDGKSMDEAIESMGQKHIDLRILKTNYYNLKKVMASYEFVKRQ